MYSSLMKFKTSLKSLKKNKNHKKLWQLSIFGVGDNHMNEHVVLCLGNVCVLTKTSFSSLLQ